MQDGLNWPQEFTAVGHKYKEQESQAEAKVSARRQYTCMRALSEEI